MKIIEQSWSFVRKPEGNEILKIIEEAGRTCYKSEDKITPESSRKFVKNVIGSGHHSVIEHASISIRIITDRSVTHELVRHRIAAYSQESTRYCNYSKDKFNNEITIILPVWFNGLDINNVQTNILNNTGTTGREMQFRIWKSACIEAENKYFSLLKAGQSPQEARSVLPNSLKTEIVMTANAREWRHVFSLRCSKKAHPQIRELMIDVLSGFKDNMPILFDDIEYEQYRPPETL